jgi:hypothetical protein
VTSDLRGIFKTNSDTRKEFLVDARWFFCAIETLKANLGQEDF